MFIKLLVVNKQDPAKTTYISKKNAGIFLLGRRLSNYIFIIVGPEFEKIVEFESSDIDVIQKQVDNIFSAFNKQTAGV